MNRPHKPSLDEMGIASYHEVLPDRPGRKGPQKPDLDSMGPGIEAIPAKHEDSHSEAHSTKEDPRSSAGKPGQRGRGRSGENNYGGG